jgi:hypothetical protein
MSYATISNWSSSVKRGSDAANNNEKTINEKYIPALKAMGANHVYFIYTSDTTVSIVAIYPDAVTATAAITKQNALRSQGSSELATTFIGESRGMVFASL